MYSKIRSFGVFFGMMASFSVVWANEPTLSLEAVEVNGNPLPGGSTGRLRISPGDVVTAHWFIRDWSPFGERLRSYQVTADPASFVGGVQPVGFGTPPPNEANALIDESDRRYVFRGRNTLPVVDTSTTAYRWISVLFDERNAFVCKQDGTKHYAGTLRLIALENANGEYEIAPTPDPNMTLLVNVSNEPMHGLKTEPLIIEVVSAEVWLYIHSSDPPNGAIDARLLSSPGKPHACGWNSIVLTSLTGNAAELKPGDFVIKDGSDHPPIVKSVAAKGTRVELMFDRAIAPFRWTSVIVKSSGSTATIGCLPGDVNNDGISDGNDVHALIEGLNGRTQPQPFQADIDGDGQVDSRDLATLIEWLGSEPGAQQRRLAPR